MRQTGRMNSVYTWSTLPWAAVLSAAAAFGGWRAWRRGDRPTAVRRSGWALVPWALWFVGLMGVVVRVGSAIASWAAGFVFRPSAWLGLAIGVVAVALVAAGSLGKRRASRTGSDGLTAKPAGSTGPAELSTRKPAVGDDDMDDIEAILRKHGIQ